MAEKINKDTIITRMSHDHRYKTSVDYRLLWKLAKDTPVVCVLDYLDCRDVACTVSANGKVAVSSRGCIYFDADNLSKFDGLCKKYNLEFIVPLEG